MEPTRTRRNREEISLKKPATMVVLDGSQEAARINPLPIPGSKSNDRKLRRTITLDLSALAGPVRRRSILDSDDSEAGSSALLGSVSRSVHSYAAIADYLASMNAATTCEANMSPGHIRLRVSLAHINPHAHTSLEQVIISGSSDMSGSNASSKTFLSNLLQIVIILLENGTHKLAKLMSSAVANFRSLDASQRGKPFSMAEAFAISFDSPSLAFGLFRYQEYEGRSDDVHHVRLSPDIGPACFRLPSTFPKAPNGTNYWFLEDISPGSKRSIFQISISYDKLRPRYVNATLKNINTLDFSLKTELGGELYRIIDCKYVSQRQMHRLASGLTDSGLNQAFGGVNSYTCITTQGPTASDKSRISKSAVIASPIFGGPQHFASPGARDEKGGDYEA
ncbi:hypothetical protein CROQUDRAFT_92880 [Cronartium quercuum f. sp. fusiforme G11]|uniref:Uncharacterized protein n=1 Tax=Cronartium quercuum f. sp. fusiforme G11 TaxID=708437 RepID=A0A9P6NG39_9BASI|nr:hypothetical protein CROQUDRAFT_92880 [Cronartium quercuum f. sp. fusiforme G11]